MQIFSWNQCECIHDVDVKKKEKLFTSSWVKTDGVFEGPPGAPVVFFFFPLGSSQVKVTLVCRHKRQQVLMALFCCSPRPPSSLRASQSLTQIPLFWLWRRNATLEVFNTDPAVIWSRIKMPRHLRRLGSETRMSPGPDRCLVFSLFICGRQ